MRSAFISTVKLVHWIRRRLEHLAGAPMLAMALVVAVGSLGVAEAAVRSSLRHQNRPPPIALAALTRPPHLQPALPLGPEWEGIDIDGDGAPDFANPTGRPPRGHDAYGYGYFHAVRDGGEREHEGVDYDSRPGQTVVAPISGYVARIGYAYPGNLQLRYVQIDNPALKLEARVFYVRPDVRVGQTVALGRPIGTALSLQSRYPGITNHVHLELDERGRHIDAQSVILARGGDSSFMAAMN